MSGECVYDADCAGVQIPMMKNSPQVYCDATGQCVRQGDAYPANVLNTYRYAALDGCTDVGPFEYYALRTNPVCTEEDTAYTGIHYYAQ